MKNLHNSIALALFTSFSAVSADNTLTVYTYDSFAAEWGPGPKVERAFEAKCNCDLKFVALDDGVSILNRLRLEGTNTKADIVLGLDKNLMPEAKSGPAPSSRPQKQSVITVFFTFLQLYTGSGIEAEKAIGYSYSADRCQSE